MSETSPMPNIFLVLATLSNPLRLFYDRDVLTHLYGTFGHRRLRLAPVIMVLPFFVFGNVEQ